MTWVKLEDRFCDNPKVAALTDRAFRTYVSSICYSTGVLSDGLVPVAVAVRLGDRRITDELSRAGLWDAVPEGYSIHDFLDYQPSRADVEAKREHLKTVRSEAGSKGASKRWGSEVANE